jgi:hypothetical protein
VRPYLKKKKKKKNHKKGLVVAQSIGPEFKPQNCKKKKKKNRTPPKPFTLYSAYQPEIFPDVIACMSAQNPPVALFFQE